MKYFSSIFIIRILILNILIHSYINIKYTNAATARRDIWTSNKHNSRMRLVIKCDER